MSGGLFYGYDTTLKTEIFKWSDNPTNVFEDKEISELVWDVLDLIHSFDYYKCDDTSKETYLKDKAEFKKKWFGGNRGLRIRKIVDESIEELRQELYESFGLKGKEIDAAIEALEKSIPKKPIMVKDTAETYYICSECEMEVDKVDDNYCSDCGQKLDWEE